MKERDPHLGRLVKKSQVEVGHSLEFQGALIKVTGGPDMTLQEAETVAEEIQNRVSPTTRIIWGAAVEPEFEGKLSVMVVITGVTSPDITGKSEVERGHGHVPTSEPEGWRGDLESVR